MQEPQNNKERIPLEYYTSLYKESETAEISARTGIPFDAERSVFTITLMCSRYEISYPDFAVKFLDGPGDFLSSYPQAQILILRFLTGGHFIPAGGKYLAYRDMPWGEVYFQNFNGRCIMRLAYTFAGKAEAVEKKMTVLGGKVYDKGDIGWEFDFMPGLSIRFTIWNPDDEFPPSAQILFSDNFHYAFSAEDMAFVGDIFIKIMSKV